LMSCENRITGVQNFREEKVFRPGEAKEGLISNGGAPELG